TGDAGRVDEDGYVFVEGRADDTIIRGGENVAPAEIEDTLLRHPGIAGAAVVGVPDEEWGERVGAVGGAGGGDGRRGGGGDRRGGGAARLHPRAPGFAEDPGCGRDQRRAPP